MTALILLLVAGVVVGLLWWARPLLTRREKTLPAAAPVAETPWLDHLLGIEGFTPTQPLLAVDGSGGIDLDAAGDRLCLLQRDAAGACDHRLVAFARVMAAEVREEDRALIRTQRGQATAFGQGVRSGQVKRLELLVTTAGEPDLVIPLLNKAVEVNDGLYQQVWERARQWHDTLAAIITLEALKAWLDGVIRESRGVVPLAALLAKLDMLGEGLAPAVVVLEKLGYGCEPDPRVIPVSLTPEEPVVLFPLDADARALPGEAFAVAAFKLHLAALVVQGDGAVSAEEEQEFFSRLEGFDVPAGEQARLTAHGRWLLARVPGFDGLAARLAALPEQDGEELARTAVAMALATVERQGVAPVAAALAAIAQLLNLDAERLLRYLPEEPELLAEAVDPEPLPYPEEAEASLSDQLLGRIDWDVSGGSGEGGFVLNDIDWDAPLSDPGAEIAPLPEASAMGEGDSLDWEPASPAPSRPIVVDDSLDVVAWEPQAVPSPTRPAFVPDEVIELDVVAWESPARTVGDPSLDLGQED